MFHEHSTNRLEYYKVISPYTNIEYIFEYFTPGMAFPCVPLYFHH